MMSVTFETVSGPVTLSQVYTPDSSYADEDYDDFSDELQLRINALPRNRKHIMLRNFNAKAGNDQKINWPCVLWNCALGTANDRGLQLQQFGAFNSQVISYTLFWHSNKRRCTWTSPGLTIRNKRQTEIQRKEQITLLRRNRDRFLMVSWPPDGDLHDKY